MRYYPNFDDPYEAEEVREIKAKPWQVQALRVNPGYMGWGPHEDCMIQKAGHDYGWAGNIVINSWEEFGWMPDNLNVVANFYFHIDRDAKQCDVCGGSGTSLDAQWVTESWYHHTSPFRVEDIEDDLQAQRVMEQIGISFRDNKLGKPVKVVPVDRLISDQEGDWAVTQFENNLLLDPRIKEMVDKYGPPFLAHCWSCIANNGEWNTSLTQDEVDRLWENRRLGLNFKEKPTVEAVNLWAKSATMPHDAINASICMVQRCKRLGIPMECETCKGMGHIYTEPEPRLELVLWVLHPHKGCGRAVTIRSIKEDQVKLAIRYLKKCHASAIKEIWKGVLKWPRLARIKKTKKARDTDGKGKKKEHPGKRYPSLMDFLTAKLEGKV